MTRMLVLALLTVAAGASADDKAATQPGTHAKSLQHDGLERTYLVHVPPSYDGSKAVAVVIACHGNGGTAQAIETRFGFDPLADQNGFIAVYPQGVDKHWNDGRTAPRFQTAMKLDDVGFFRLLIETLQKDYKIDPDRIYVTGFSNGGFISHRLGWALSDVLAAIAPVSGTMDKEMVAKFAPKHPVHVLEIHGAKDATVPYNGGPIARQGGNAIAALELARMWAKADGCGDSEAVEVLPKVAEKPGLEVRRTTFAKGKSGAEVVVYTVGGLGHDWVKVPFVVEKSGQAPVNTAELIWHFFEHHSKVK